MSKYLVIGSLFTLCILGLTHCYGGSDPNEGCDTVEATFSSIQTQVFSKNCTTSECHGKEQKGNMDLRKSEAYDQLINVTPEDNDASEYKRIVPGDPDSSFLYLKITGQQANNEGVDMPKKGDKLCDAKIEAIKQWILNGANND